VTVAGWTEYEKGTSTAPFLLAPAAVAGSSPAFIDPDMVRYLTPGMPLTSNQNRVLTRIQLTAEERADNNRYDLLMQTVPNQPTIRMYRVSYWWPASFFEQNGEQLHLHYLLTGIANSGLVTDVYEYGSKVTKFGKQGVWFKVWRSGDLKPGFIYRKGDVINFGGGHTTIVVGDNTYNDVVVSQMSYNRTRQSYPVALLWENDFPQSKFDHYGVTRDKLSDLKAGLGPAKTTAAGRSDNAFTKKDHSVYRLMPWLKGPDPQFFQLNQLTTQAHKSYRQYIVRKGETLSAIAQKPTVQSDLTALAEANGIADPDWVQAGDVLWIP
jgi:hypothetical protein